MANKLRFDGLRELQKELRELPAALRDEATGIVANAAQRAYEEIKAAYPEGQTGNLRAGLTVSPVRGRAVTPGTPQYGVDFGVRYIVRNRAKHSWLHENGTAARQVNGRPPGRIGNYGVGRGSMPAAHVFIPIAIARRDEMERALWALVQRGGGLQLVA